MSHARSDAVPRRHRGSAVPANLGFEGSPGMVHQAPRKSRVHDSRSSTETELMKSGAEASPAQQCEMALEELLDSERSYVQHLARLHDHFYLHLTAHLELDDAIIDDDAIKKVFMNVPTLLRLNRGLLEDLEQLSFDRKLMEGVGGVFKRYAALFKQYSDFAAQHPTALHEYERLRRQNKRFVAFMNVCEKVVNKKFESLMIMPVQRVPRYMLLLQHIKKAWTVADPKATADLSQACDTISETASHINEATRHIQARMKVVSLQKLRFNDTIQLVERWRWMVHNGELKKVHGHGLVSIGSVELVKTHRKYGFYLFNDMIMYCTRPGTTGEGNVPRFKRAIPLAGMVASDVPNKPCWLSITPAVTLDPRKPFCCIAKSPEARNEWVRILQEHIKLASDPKAVKHKSEDLELMILGRPTALHRLSTSESQAPGPSPAPSSSAATGPMVRHDSWSRSSMSMSSVASSAIGVTVGAREQQAHELQQQRYLAQFGHPPPPPPARKVGGGLAGDASSVSQSASTFPSARMREGAAAGGPPAPPASASLVAGASISVSVASTVSVPASSPRASLTAARLGQQQRAHQQQGHGDEGGSHRKHREGVRSPASSLGSMSSDSSATSVSTAHSLATVASSSHANGRSYPSYAGAGGSVAAAAAAYTSAAAGGSSPAARGRRFGSPSAAANASTSRSPRSPPSARQSGGIPVPRVGAASPFSASARVYPAANGGASGRRGEGQQPLGSSRMQHRAFGSQRGAPPPTPGSNWL